MLEKPVRPVALPLGSADGNPDGVHRFALQDEFGRTIGTFASHRRGWRVGDWVLTRDGRRLQIVGVLPATHAGAEAGVSEVWLVESA